MAIPKSVSFPDDKLNLIQEIADLAEDGESWSSVVIDLLEEGLAARRHRRAEADQHNLRVEQALARIERRLSGLTITTPATEDDRAADMEAIAEVKKAIF